MKAELELLQGEREESGMDLDKVRFLLELCTGLLNVQIQMGSDIDSVLHICIVRNCVCSFVFLNCVAHVHSLKWIVLQNWQNKLQLLCYS